MTASAGTIRLYRPDPTTLSETKRSGRATFSVRPASATRTVIAACGDIDAVNGRSLGHYVERHSGTSKQLILDLRAVDFFGTQGFTALHYIGVHCTRRDVDWMLIGSPPVWKLLGICDTAGELPLCPDLDTALVQLDQRAQHHRRIASVG